MQFSSTVHKSVLVTFTNCLQSNILKAVALEEWACQALHMFFDLETPKNTSKQYKETAKSTN